MNQVRQLLQPRRLARWFGIVIVGSLILVLVTVASADKTADNVVFSDFDLGGFDGWTVDIENPDFALENPGQGGCCGGTGSNGFLFAIPDGDAMTTYFLAPAKFVDALREKEVMELLFDLMWDGEPDAFYYESGFEARGDVVIGQKDGDEYLACASHSWTAGDFPRGEWVSMEIPIDDASWDLCAGTGSLQQLLDNATSLEIRAEYGVFQDETSLDNVALFFERNATVEPRSGVVQVDGQTISDPTTLLSDEELRLRQNAGDNSSAYLSCEEEAAILITAGILRELAEEHGNGIDVSEIVLQSGGWKEAFCGETRALRGSGAIAAASMQLNIGDAILQVAAAGHDIVVETSQLTAVLTAGDSAAIAYDPSSGVGGVGVLSGQVEVTFKGAGQPPATIEQGSAIIVDEGGPQAPQMLPQLFLPVVR